MRHLVTATVFAGSLALGACSGKSKIPGASLFKKSGFQVQPYEVKTLPNGLTLIFVQDDALPQVGLRVLVKAGLAQEPANKAGVNSMVASLLSQGTTTKNAIQTSDGFNALGTEFRAAAGGDSVIATADALSSDADALLALFAEVVMKPTFSVQEVNRLKNQRIAALKRRIDNPSTYSRLKFAEYLYEGTSYSRDVMGTVPSIQGLKQADIIRFYLANYRPNNTLLAVTGRFDSEFRQKVAATFGEWTARELKTLPEEVAAPPESFQLKLVSKPGLAQAQILLGRPTIRRADPDYLALRVANEALGGGFGARLMQRVRDDLGLTYSAYSSLTSNPSMGVFQIATFTKNPTTGQVITETLKVYDQFVQEGLTEKELASAKSQIVGQYPRGLETADAVASSLMTLNMLGLPYDEIEKMPAKIEKLTLKEVNAALQKHLKANALKAVVYADRAAVLPQLKPFNPVIEAAR